MPAQAQYPNVYYTLDTSDFTPLFEAKSKEEFIADVTARYTDYLSQALRWQPLPERYPSRFLWGTDRAVVWHFDPEVSAVLAQLSRDFIGQLSPAVQKSYAYQNAERLFADK